jgi:hypothetical protein
MAGFGEDSGFKTGKAGLSFFYPKFTGTVLAALSFTVAWTGFFYGGGDGTTVFWLKATEHTVCKA